jgi:hypothetical protein
MLVALPVEVFGLLQEGYFAAACVAADYARTAKSLTSMSKQAKPSIHYSLHATRTDALLT